MRLNPEEAKKLIEKTLALSKAEEATVRLTESQSSNIRFANNEVSTSGDASNLVLNVRSSFGKRTGAATTNQFDQASLEQVVRKSEEIARFSPEDPEKMPLLGAQQYQSIAAFDEATADAAPDVRTNVAKQAIRLAKEKDVVIAGFLEHRGTTTAIGNSAGLFGFHRQTFAALTETARTKDGTGSGWAGNNAERIADLDATGYARTAVEKAYRSARPREMAPGTYTVILEPAAVADLLMYLSFFADARTADEGRSVFSKKGGGNLIGEKVLDPRVTIWSDPADPRAPVSPISEELLPQQRLNFMEEGVLRNLYMSRFWAQKQNKEPLPQPENLLMKGGSSSVQDLVRGTKKGILVTRLWYIRVLDPQSVMLTGLTRDGVFYVENGKIKYPLKNFRWNDSPISVFANAEAMSREVRARGSESEEFPIVCPAIRTKFNFSSISEAV